ncbi:MAG: putative lipid II flippase FtsW [Endomicrobium sp.]|jgi:cell division protein FtsW|nr:putative lipid II flippase FtsW [Endomicrobium sp.]
MIKLDFKRIDLKLMFLVCLCVIFGTFMVFSSSFINAYVRWSSPYRFFFKQILWLLIGVCAMFVTAFVINYKLYEKYAKIIYIFFWFLVVIVLFLGKSRLGAKRWLGFGFFTIQPSEFAKIAVVILLSDFISRKKEMIVELKGLIAPLLMLIFMLVPIALEPDLGTPILISAVCLAMLFCAGLPIKVLLTGCVFGAVLVAEEIIRKPYRVARFRDYLASFVNINAASYQVKQSLNALGAGGFFGRGPGKSEMKLMYLPESHTDFIFPIIGEELGFLGACIVVSFFIYLFFNGIKMSRSMPDVFSEHLCLGITFIIVFQAIINLSVATGLFPAKGLPLPFISFGGTSLAVSMAEAGILINLSRYNKNKI